MTTVASVWTSAQFLDSTAIKGPALGLRIASGNLPNFVDLQTGRWGGTIQDPLNSSQTPTMANFATLADLLSACVTQVRADACSSLFEAAMPPTGSVLLLKFDISSAIGGPRKNRTATPSELDMLRSIVSNSVGGLIVRRSPAVPRGRLSGTS